ncbi:tail protein [Pseudomonas phage WP1]
MKDYVASQKLTEVDWADVVSKPNVAIQYITPWFASLELSDARPFIDFHFSSSRARDFDYRFISEADGSMAFYSRQGQLVLPRISCSGGRMLHSSSRDWMLRKTSRTSRTLVPFGRTSPPISPAGSSFSHRRGRQQQRGYRSQYHQSGRLLSLRVMAMGLGVHRTSCSAVVRSLPVSTFLGILETLIPPPG